MSSDTVPVDTINRAIDGDLDSLIVAVRALEIPLKHELALKYLTELRDARLEAYELSSEVVRQMREIASLHRQVDNMARTIVDLCNDRDRLRRAAA